MNKTQKQWLTGFFEGDGCAYAGKAPQIIFTQKYADVLEYIQKMVGMGSIHKRITMQKIGKFTHYRLDISGKANCLKFIKLVADYVVSQHSIERLKNLRNRFGITEESLSIKENGLSKAWAVGYFDAEGSCVFANIVATPARKPLATLRSPTIKFGVKDSELLDKLQKVIGGVRSEPNRRSGQRISFLTLHGESRDFIKQIFKYSHSFKRDKLYKELALYSSTHQSCYSKGGYAWREFCGSVFVGEVCR